jgi:hypothetical protein
VNVWTVEFIAPTAPWSVNARMHHMSEHRIARQWRETAARSARFQLGFGVTLPACEVHVAIPFPRAGRRDPHNYVGTVVKRIVDGLGPELVRRTGVSPGAGLWPDDTPEWVTVIEPSLAVRPDRLVVVTLTERHLVTNE